MLQAIIHRLLARRHFWRHATFSEVAELYVSRLVNIFAFRFVMIFSSVYLYELGYSLAVIGLLWAGYFGLKGLFAWPAALVAAWFGPKHGMLYANVINAISMIFLLIAPQVGITAILAWFLLLSVAAALNNVCYVVDFSKVKHTQHAGKELGYMNILEKIGAGLGPVAGGVVASLFGPAVAVFIASILFLCSAWPLFRTGEQTVLRQKLTFKGFPWRTTWRNMVAQTGVGADVFATNHAWTLCIAVVILGMAGTEIYAQIGAFTSITLFVAMLASYGYGRMIDHRAGKALMLTGVAVNSITHLLRPTVSTPLGIVLANTANEAGTAAYHMAFTRGEFDSADMSGHRIVYLTCMEVALSLGSVLSALGFALLCVLLPDNRTLFDVFFIFIAFATLIIATPRFALYKR